MKSSHGQAYQFHTCLRWLSEAVGPLPRRTFMQISPGDCPSKAATPYTIGTRRTMCQPRLLVSTLPTVVADATETSCSPRRLSNLHWILHTSEVGYVQEKEKDQESVEFVILHVANSLLIWSNLLGDAYHGKTAIPSVVRDPFRGQDQSSNSARSGGFNNRINFNRTTLLDSPGPNASWLTVLRCTAFLNCRR